MTPAAKHNSDLLNSCPGPHNFSIIVDPDTHEDIRNPTPEQRYGCRYRCTLCRGDVNGPMRYMYYSGMRHAFKSAETMTALVKDRTKTNVQPTPQSPA